MHERALAELAERVRPAGVVIARFDARSVRVSAHGEVTPDDRFEIGSVTKLFTARALETLAAEGALRLDERARTCLGPGWRIGKAVTLEQLARHTSGLPGMPRRAWLRMLRAPGDPYRHLTVEDLRRSLPPLIPRSHGYRYSNFGYALLGHALARRCGEDWQALVRTRVMEPLGLARTGVGGEIAQPHDGRGRPVPAWTLTALEAAGALRSTAHDLVAFARAAPPGLGWIDGKEIRWHNGATGGSCCFVAVTRDGGGVVALANAAVVDELSMLGAALARGG